MSVPYVFTVSDALDNLIDFASGWGVGVNQPALRRVIQQSYRELAQAFDWSFLYGNGRIQLQAAQTLTAAYDHTGGTYERELTATAAFPDWIEDAAVRIDGIVCDVESLKDNTDPYIVTLDATMNPGADVASAEVTVYPRWYILPNDFMSMKAPLEETTWLRAECVSQADMLALDRNRDTTGDIRWYSVGPAQDLYGSMALYVHPASDETETLDFPYKKRQRAIRYTGHDSADYAGTVDITAGSATVTGTDTSFAEAMVGSIFRVGTASAVPTGMEGLTPWVEQRNIIAVASTTSLTLDAEVTTAYDDFKYRISDPLDMDVAAYDALLRVCEKNLAIAKDFKDKGLLIKIAKDAVFEARGGDSRVRQRRIAGEPARMTYRLKDSTDRPIVP